VATPVRVNEDLYGLTELRDRLPQVVEKARQTKRPMIIARQNKALAAIVDIDELQRLYELEQSLDDYGVVQAFLAAEASGEVEWLTTEQVEQFDRQIVTEANAGAARQRTTQQRNKPKPAP
jgi:prevent-host-death family protein